MIRLEDYANLRKTGLVAQPTPQPQQQITPPADGNYIGWMSEMLGPTPAEREAQERRLAENKAKMAGWAGLFQGLGALGDLYYASKGATPVRPTYNPQQQIEQNYQQERQRLDDLYKNRQAYATMLYNMHRQGEEERRKDAINAAQLEWYKNRDEQNAEKVAIQRMKAENDAAYKTATLEQKERMNDIMAEYYAGRISLTEAQTQLAKVRAAHVGAGGGRGANNGTYGYKTTTYYDDQGRKVTERVPTTGGKPETRVQEPKKSSQKRNTRNSNSGGTNNSGFFNK